jgi:predicted PurR-regulated permease PerM
MIHQFQALVHDFPGYFATLQERSARFRGVSDRLHLTGRIQGFLASLPGRLGSGLLGYTRRLFGALATALTVAVLAVYFMTGLPRLRHGVRKLFPKAHRARFGQIADVMVDKVGAYMIGNLLISLAAGLATFAVFAALGVPFAVPLALVVALCDLIPMIGATLGAVICVAAALLTTELWPTTVIVAIFFVAYQQLENYLIAPRILRHTVSMSAAAVLLAALIGGTLLGLVGALMAIPIAAALKVVLAERLHARDTADADTEPSGDGQAAEAPGTADDALPAPAPAGGTTPTPAAPSETSPALASADVTAPTPAPATTDRS